MKTLWLNFEHILKCVKGQKGPQKIQWIVHIDGFIFLENILERKGAKCKQQTLNKKVFLGGFDIFIFLRQRKCLFW